MKLEFSGTAGEKTQMIVLPIFNKCIAEILSEKQIEDLNITIDLSRAKAYEKDPSDVSILYPDEKVPEYRLYVLANLNKTKEQGNDSAKNNLFNITSLMALHVCLIKMHLDGDLSFKDDREYWKGEDVTDTPVEELEYLKIASSESEEAVDNFMEFASNAVRNLFT